MEYYPATKKHEVPVDARSWMNLENIMINEKSQIPKVIRCRVPLTWNNRIDNTQRQYADRWLPGAGKRSDRG